MRGRFRIAAAIATALLLVPLVAIIVVEARALTESRSSERAFDVFTASLRSLEAVSSERGPSDAALASITPLDPLGIDTLHTARHETDARLKALSAALTEQGSGRRADESRRYLSEARGLLNSAREKVDAALAKSPTVRTRAETALAFSTMVNVEPSFFRIAETSLLAMPNGEVRSTAPLRSAIMAASLRDEAGLLASRFTSALLESRPLSDEEQAEIDVSMGRIQLLMSMLSVQTGLAQDNASESRDKILSVYGSQGLGYVEQIRSKATIGDAGVTFSEFGSTYRPYMVPITQFRDDVLKLAAHDRHVYATDAARRLVLATTGAALLIAGMAVVVWSFERRIVRPLTTATDAIRSVIGEPDAGDGRDGELRALETAVTTLRTHERDRRSLERERVSMIENLRAIADTDALTGLLNRRAFETAWTALAQSATAPYVALILFDVDRFKSINDTYGHAVGDKALQRIADIARSTWRTGDVIARIGGEEFAVAIGVNSPEAAVATAERFRSGLLHRPLDVDGVPLSFTVSMGVVYAATGAPLDRDNVLKQSDMLLYRAKQNGRDRVEHAALSTTSGDGGI